MHLRHRNPILQLHDLQHLNLPHRPRARRSKIHLRRPRKPLNQRTTLPRLHPRLRNRMVPPTRRSLLSIQRSNPPKRSLQQPLLQRLHFQLGL